MCASFSKDSHLFYDYGFAIPAGSTLNGIEVRLDAWADSTAGSPFMCADLSWNGALSFTAAKTTPALGTSEGTFILGSSSDTWGRTWSAADFSDTNLFVVRITDVASDITRTFELDWVSVNVTYTPPSQLRYTPIANCSANAAVTSGSGDNNGYETNPSNACASDGL